MTDPSRTTVENLQRQEVRKLEKKGRRAVEKTFNTLQALTIEYVSPNDVYPNAYNPNRQTDREFELLCSSMKEDGFTTPILVHAKTKEIVDGEHRWRAAQHLGLKEIPAVFVDMTMEQMRISTLRHNRARGSEDIELSIRILQDLREIGALDHAVDSLGMSDRELQALISDLPAPEAMAAESFSDSWVPIPDKLEEGTTDMKNRIVSTSPGIAAHEARLSAKADGATSEEEHQVILLTREHVPQKIVVLIDPEYADTFVKVFKTRPAERILALCRYHTSKGLGPIA